MSIINTRRNALVPNRDGVSLGTDGYRWNTIFSCNVHATGCIEAVRFIGDGSQLTNLSLPPTKDISALDIDILPDRNLTRDIGAPLFRFMNVYTRNLNAQGNVTAANFYGSGNNLTFDRITSSIVPQIESATLGTLDNPFNIVYANNILALSDIKASRFIGDGSLLTNIKIPPLTINASAFKGIMTSVTPGCNAMFDIGTPLQRFNNAYVTNISAAGIVTGTKFLITTEGIQINVAPSSSSGSTFTMNLEPDILEKLGHEIDVSAKSIVGGVIVANEFIGDGSLIYNVKTLAPQQSNIVPYMPSMIELGSSNVPFKSLHVDDIQAGGDMLIEGTMLTKGDITVEGDLRVMRNFYVSSFLSIEGGIQLNGSISASNLVGDGRFIDNITHFGEITSNIYPFKASTIEIGSDMRPFRVIHTDEVNAYMQLSAGRIGVGTSTPSKLLDVQGDINFTGNLFKDGMMVSASPSGYCKPREQRIETSKIITYLGEAVGHFIDLDCETGEFKCTQNGVYNVTGYVWRTSRSYNDLDTAWSIIIHSIYNVGVMRYDLKGGASQNFVLQAGDTFTIMIHTGVTSASVIAPPMTLLPGSAFILTMVAVLPSMLELYDVCGMKDK